MPATGIVQLKRIAEADKCSANCLPVYSNMSRLSCADCGRPQGYCYCHLLQPVANRWPVCILQHPDEARHPLNTAGIAAGCLQHCRLVQIPDDCEDATLQARVGNPATGFALIYPATAAQADTVVALQARGAATEQTALPTLLFLDASWRKSRRMLLQSPWLRTLPRYALPTGEPSRYRIRQEPREDCVSTLEAVARTLVVLDDCAPERMYTAMDWVIARQIAAMGEHTWRRNYRRAPQGCGSAGRG